MPGHRHLRSEQVVAGIQAALQAGAFTADAVALEARKAADTDPSSVATNCAAANDEPGQVGSLTEQRLTHLPSDTRPLPTMTPYDQLLGRSKETS